MAALWIVRLSVNELHAEPAAGHLQCRAPVGGAIVEEEHLRRPMGA